MTNENENETTPGNGSTPTPEQLKVLGGGPTASSLDPDAPGHYCKTRELMSLVTWIGQNIVFDTAGPLLMMLQQTMKPLADLPPEPEPPADD